MPSLILKRCDKVKRLFPLLLVVVLTVTACGGNTNVSPLGKWSQEDGNYFEFREGGEVVFTQDGYVYGGSTWQMNNGTIEIISFGVVVFEGSISGNKLTIWPVTDSSSKRIFVKEP